jgi:membrane-bound lytic murein transglycosylase MltF
MQTRVNHPRILAVAFSFFAATTLLATPSQAQLRKWLGMDPGIDRTWTGDFDGMVKRRQIRILVVHSKTFYFIDSGAQRGFSYDAGRAFEDAVNKKLGLRLLRVEAVFIPVSAGELLPALLNGRGDIAIANLTVTPERQQFVDFSVPLWTGVDEIVVTGPASPPIASVDDLSGQEVFVRLSSSYFQSLWHVNERFGKSGLPPLRVKAAPEQLEDEDILEMLNAGLIPLAVVDSHKAEFWAQLLPNIRLHPEASVRTGGEIAWAFRKNSPQLAAVVNEFAAKHGKGSAFGNAKFKEYLRNTQYVKGASSTEEFRKLLRTIQIFQKYAKQYDFDWLMLAAQGYQESRLDQGVKSRVGAVGVMQVMPATGKELEVGDIREIEPNIHAGAKYLRAMMERYFSGAQLDGLNRQLFAFASYNAGPARIAKLRKEAEAQGLDPNVWFNNVEIVASKRIGQETVRYVGNIFKYYVAYKLVVDAQAERDRALQGLGNR